MSTPSRNSPEIVTFGCRLNTFESEVMRDALDQVGASDVVVVNTCAVTAEAERQARQAIRRLRRDRPEAEIIVTGCAAQIDPTGFSTMPEVDRVVGNAEKLKAETFAAQDPILVEDIMAVQEMAPHMVSGLEGRSRAFVQVQNGCDHRCTFCIIPYGRGNSRSQPMGAIVDQVKKLVANGYKEAVITGVDITSYGSDLPGQPSLGQMIRRLLKAVPELPRLRLSSIDCIEMDEDLLKVIAEEDRLMPYFHLSLQAGDDMILKRMKRRHSRSEAITLVHRIRDLRPEAVFGADLIAGFPTETDAMFENTAAMVGEAGLTLLHVFPYSERPGTPAARIPNQVPGPVRKERAAHLRALGTEAEARHLASREGQNAMVLIERQGVGRTEDFTPVRLSTPIDDGALVPVRLGQAKDGLVEGTLLDMSSQKQVA